MEFSCVLFGLVPGQEHLVPSFFLVLLTDLFLVL